MINKHSKSNCRAGDMIIAGPTGLQCANCLAIFDYSDVARKLASRGGKKSVSSRFAGKSKKEISEMMRNVRYSKKELQTADKIADILTKNLNKNVK